ncbi:solute carrier family 15 member 1-like [Engraulis encrasicolus]|uniref:solute carrier family 15 member 1-like n=1 Tax=Engraulis encrasicolus TaxID=184585 RepID=UPI002FD46F5E
MRAVLVLYFTYFLRWDEDLSTSIYHAFVACCYLTPILGAIIADSWLGKFKTIIYLSIVYAVGQVVMAVSAIHDITDANKDGVPDNLTLHVVLAMIGLFLIALGTGGIKPCVSAFGGDQFEDHQTRQRSTFFSVFYLCINAGSLLSTIITPILRAQECGIHSQQKCYPLAFGVPAALMVVALVVFVVGSGMYVKTAPTGNIMGQVSKCIGFAIKNRYRHRSSQYPSREHWMDWATEKYDKLLIQQIKMVLKVLFLYLPLPMFWTLFDQKGSRWTLQATTMDGNFGFLILQPDQMQTLNPILILTLVPITDRLIYPLIEKCGFNFSPLKRMTVGMFLAAMAFISAGFVQLEIDKTLPVFPTSTEAQVRVLNMRTTELTVTIPPYESFQLGANQANGNGYLTFVNDEIDVSLGSPNEPGLTNVTKGIRQTLVITPVGVEVFNDTNSKPGQGNNAVRFISATAVSVSGGEVETGSLVPFTYSNYTLVPRGTKTFTISSDVGGQPCEYTKDFGFGASYSFVIPATISGENCGVQEVEEMQPNSVHMALQIPQYFFITAGEVVFSVTGLEFSYSQAPSNMKAVLQAGWLLTTAMGNFIVLIVAQISKLVQMKRWAEYILFASLLLVVCVIFSVMAYFYTYIDPVAIEAEFKRKEGLDEKDEKGEKDEKEKLELKEKEAYHDDDEEEPRQTKM